MEKLFHPILHVNTIFFGKNCILSSVYDEKGVCNALINLRYIVVSYKIVAFRSAFIPD